jgi:hypothetical protein
VPVVFGDLWGSNDLVASAGWNEGSERAQAEINNLLHDPGGGTVAQSVWQGVVPGRIRGLPS